MPGRPWSIIFFYKLDSYIWSYLCSSSDECQWLAVFSHAFPIYARRWQHCQAAGSLQGLLAMPSFAEGPTVSGLCLPVSSMLPPCPPPLLSPPPSSFLSAGRNGTTAEGVNTGFFSYPENRISLLNITSIGKGSLKNLWAGERGEEGGKTWMTQGT